MSNFIVYQGLAEEVIDQFNNKSVDCIFTSPEPPRTTEELLKLIEIFAKCKRIVKDMGRVWVNISNAYRNNKTGGIAHMAEMFVMAMEQEKWINRDTLIWWRYPPDKSKPEDPYRFRHDFEYIFGFAHDMNHYFNDRLGLHNTSVIQVPYERHKEHEFRSGFPEKLVEIPLKTTTQPGDIVLDPFVGSGTTGVVALKLGREFIGIDKARPEYIEKIEDRLRKFGFNQKILTPSTLL